SLEENIFFIRGNAEKVKQVLLNVMTNALEATLSGGFVFASTKSLINLKRDESGFVEIEISNSGIGIDEDNLKKIFDPFFTTKTGGLGLGLSICQDIVKQHNGSIDVTSERDKKTSFSIKFPIYKVVSREKSVLL
ncbi:hypothetical protein MNBD_BACTEROID05-335, partial [hydrothermal vent metagenome]